MSRVVVQRSLPPLKQVLATFVGFPEGKSRQQAMIDELRAVAKASRTSSHQPFYSMREVAEFFGVQLGTITPVYKTLEVEGIISRIRGSRTILLGNRILPREPIRGVVGIPILTNSVMLLEYTRKLATELQEHLRHSGYVSEIIFYSEKEQEGEPDFAARLLSHHLDAVVLHSPIGSCRANILSLRERGVRVLVIQGQHAAVDLAGINYLQDCRPAYHEMAARWRQIGIHEAWIWPPFPYLHCETEAKIFKAICARHRVRAELVRDEPKVLLKRIRRHRSKKAVAILDLAGGEQVCNGDSCEIEKIAEIARLGLCSGAIRSPYLKKRNVCADVVSFSPTETASRLADDICRLSVLPDGVYHTFIAQYHEQMPF